MEGLSLSTGPAFPSLLSQRPPHHSPFQFTSKRLHIARQRRKRARLQPRLASTITMSPAQDPATGETGSGSAAQRIRHAHSLSGTITTRPRRTTAQSDIHETILHPGNVKINVQGAFIVDEEQPGTPQSEDYEHDPKDIRLPNHTAVVSHIAVDVSIDIPSHVSVVSRARMYSRTRQRSRPCRSGQRANLYARRLEAPWPSSCTSPANMATTRSVAA